MGELTKHVLSGRTGEARVQYRRNDDLQAEAVDPYAMGYDCINTMDDLDEPPPCPFDKDGKAAALWRKGYSAKVDLIIADTRRWGGLDASLTR
jgi:hypothetical protein